jgi:hypothetical protein
MNELFYWAAALAITLAFGAHAAHESLRSVAGL